MGMFDYLQKGMGMLSNPGAMEGLAYIQARRMGVDPITAMSHLQQMRTQRERTALYRDEMERRKEEEERQREAEGKETAQGIINRAIFENISEKGTGWLGNDPQQIAASLMSRGMSPQEAAVFAKSPDSGNYEIKQDANGNYILVAKEPGYAPVPTGVSGPKAEGSQPRIVKDEFGTPRYEDGKPVFGGDGPGVTYSRKMEGELRDEFGKKTQPYVEQMRSAGRVLSILEQGGGGVADLALVTQFMKMLDPGSTVREGEIANVQNAAGVPEQVRTFYNSLISGDSLSVGQRHQVKNIIQGSYQSAYDLYAEQAEAYRELSKRYLLSPENVILGGLRYTPEDFEKALAKPEMPMPGQIVDGWKFKGGDPSKPESWEKI